MSQTTHLTESHSTINNVWSQVALFYCLHFLVSNFFLFLDHASMLAAGLRHLRLALTFDLERESGDPTLA
jgi:hypothetical protein